LDDQIEVLYRLYVMTFERREWFRNPRATRSRCERLREQMVREMKTA